MGKKKTFKIEIYELHSTVWEVEASSLQEAIGKACEGDGTMGEMDFIETADRYGANGIREVTMPNGKVLDPEAIEDQLSKEMKNETQKGNSR